MKVHRTVKGPASHRRAVWRGCGDGPGDEPSGSHCRPCPGLVQTRTLTAPAPPTEEQSASAGAPRPSSGFRPSSSHGCLKMKSAFRLFSRPKLAGAVYQRLPQGRAFASQEAPQQGEAEDSVWSGEGPPRPSPRHMARRSSGLHDREIRAAQLSESEQTRRPDVLLISNGPASSAHAGSQQSRAGSAQAWEAARSAALPGRRVLLPRKQGRGRRLPAGGARRGARQGLGRLLGSLEARVCEAEDAGLGAGLGALLGCGRGCVASAPEEPRPGAHPGLAWEGEGICERGPYVSTDTPLTASGPPTARLRGSPGVPVWQQAGSLPRGSTGIQVRISAPLSAGPSLDLSHPQFAHH